MSLARTTDPAVEPVTLAEAKAQANVYFDDDDAFITALIPVAREVSEAATWRQLITATYQLKILSFPPDHRIELPRPPLQSVTSITYVDTAGDTQTLSTDVYAVDTASEPGRILLKYGQSWPAVRSEEDAVTVTFVAGYGDTAADVPGAVKQAILMRIAHWYQHREPTVTGTIIATVPQGPSFLDDRIKFRHTLNIVKHGVAEL